MKPDIGAGPILDAIAEIAFDASGSKKPRAPAVAKIRADIEAKGRELIEIGFDRSIIAVYQEKRELR